MPEGGLTHAASADFGTAPAINNTMTNVTARENPFLISSSSITTKHEFSAVYTAQRTTGMAKPVGNN